MDTELREQAARVVALVPRLMRQLFAIGARDPTAVLSVAQLRVCALLTDGPLPMSAISRELGISQSATTQIADRLERAGFVERGLREGDRRVRVLTLTPRALRMMRLRHQRRVDRVITVLDRLSEDARRDLVNALELLAAAAYALPAGRPRGQAAAPEEQPDPAQPSQRDARGPGDPRAPDEPT